MSEEPADDTANLEALARRTLDLMQDQVSAMAADRQTVEQMQRWLQAVMQLSGPMAAAQAMAGTMSANALAGWAGMWQQAWAAAGPAPGRASGPGSAGEPEDRRGDGYEHAGSAERAGGAESDPADAPGNVPGGVRGNGPGIAPAGAAAPAAAPGDGGAGVERLEARIAELEARLAELGSGTDGAGGRARPRQRKRKA